MKRKNFLKLLALAPLTSYAMNLNELKNITDNLSGGNKMPAFFVGHGSPMNALADNAFTQALNNLGKNLTDAPKAILVVSAHWLTKGSFVNTSKMPETIHDFGGFPQELFDMQYPSPGSPEFAQEVTKLAASVHPTEDWGLDHGAWAILKHIFPKADIPVFQMSIDYYASMEKHFELAQQLRSLRNKGVLIIGSGNIVHNLSMSMPKFMHNDSKPFEWAIEFDEWVKQKIAQRDFKTLFDYEKAGSSGKLAVPTTDHYIPMIYSLGFAEDKEEIITVYEEVSFGGMSMRTFKIG